MLIKDLEPFQQWSNMKNISLITTLVKIYENSNSLLPNVVKWSDTLFAATFYQVCLTILRYYEVKG